MMELKIASNLFSALPGRKFLSILHFCQKNNSVFSVMRRSGIMNANCLMGLFNCFYLQVTRAAARTTRRSATARGVKVSRRVCCSNVCWLFVMQLTDSLTG